MRMRVVLQWPVREVLLAYVERMREAEAHNYEVSLGVWAAKSAFGGGVKPPELPPLLRGAGSKSGRSRKA